MKYLSPLSFCSLLFGLTLLSSSPVPGATIHVPADHPTIQAGIDAAADGDTVLVADGTYTGEGNRDISFNGKAITVQSAGRAESCIIDCQGAQAFIFDSDEGSDAVLQGFTIKNGFANSDHGGGVKVSGCSPTILANHFINNQADLMLDYGGGGLYYRGDGLVAGNRFIDNEALYGGGAWLDGEVNFRDNLLTNNFAYDYGGGLLVAGATVTGCTIASNEAGVLAGGIHANDITITDSILWNNISDGAGTDLYCVGYEGTVVDLSWSDIDRIYIGSNVTVVYGPGLIDAYPLFVEGPRGTHYLKQTAAGQTSHSPCVDAGDPSIVPPEGTTRTDSMADSDIIDMGYHYPTAGPGLVAGPGAGPGNPPVVRIFSPQQSPLLLSEFTAYSATGYGVNVACGNLTGSGLDEIITGPGPGAVYGPHVRGFTEDGTPLSGLSFLAYGTNKYGVNVAAGDLDGNGTDEIITGAGPGAVFGPHVRGWIYSSASGVTPYPGVNYFAYGTPKWGVNVAAGDIDGDGFDEIVTGAGPGAVYGPHVRGWNVDGGIAAAISNVSFLAYGTNKFGVNVSCGDVDGDGMDEIITGAGPGAIFGPHVRGWNYDGDAITPLPGFSIFAWDTEPLSFGANVFAGIDLNNDGRDELVAGRGPDPDADTEVKVFTYDGKTVDQWLSLEAFPDLAHGTNVAAGRF